MAGMAGTLVSVCRILWDLMLMFRNGNLKGNGDGGSLTKMGTAQPVNLAKGISKSPGNFVGVRPHIPPAVRDPSSAIPLPIQAVSKIPPTPTYPHPHNSGPGISSPHYSLPMEERYMLDSATLGTIDPFIVGLEVQRGWSATCVCGRTFPTPSGYSTHIASCKIYRQKLAHEQSDARSQWELRNEGRAKGAAAIRSMLKGDLDFDIPFPAPRLSEEQQVEPAPISEQGHPITDDQTQPGPSVHTAHPGETSLAATTHDTSVDDGLPPIEQQGRGMRQKKTTTRLKDFVPHGKVPLGLASAVNPPTPMVPERADDDDPVLQADPGANPSTHPPLIEIPAPQPLPVRQTTKDGFGLYKRYQTEERIPHDPDAYTSLADMQDDPAEEFFDTLQQEEKELYNPSIYPYPNQSSFELGQWFWGDHSEKSLESFRNLVSIVGSDTFRPEDVREANWAAIDRELGSSQFEQKDPTDSPWYDDGTSWATASVTIDVPFNTRSDTPGPLPYMLKDFRYRPLVPLIRQKLETTTNQEYFHHIPHELRWQAGEDKQDVRVHCELYQSDAFLEAYDEVQTLPREGPDDDLPRCVVGLMFASDSTMLAHFGDANLWPLYMFYGNESKYRRSKTSLQLGEQVAYFEKLPDNFKDWFLGHSGQTSLPRPVQTHCHRELLHSQLRVIFDDEFMHAYQHGIVVLCTDGVKRRFYPRILTYSADYPEKIILASIKNLGLCPCTRCSIPMKHVHRLGMSSDRKNRTRLARIDDEDRRDVVAKARALIYGKNYSVSNKTVSSLLSAQSLVPTRNAFSERFSEYNFNVFDMLTSDVMHEVEIGSWKSLFIQLLRLLDALPGNLANILDARFRQIPTFGKDTIRRFRNNMSEMKQLAARDYEDLLQCAIPVFEGLLDDAGHNKIVLSLLFILAHWHGLAKLRMHTDHTLQILDDRTTDLGAAFRSFLKDVCQKVETKELKREAEARKRREAKKAQKKKGGKPSAKASSSGRKDGPPASKRRKLNTSDSSEPAPASASSRKPKTFSLHTYKFHALGHVVTNIRRFGCSDNYSTQGPESYHRGPKRAYKRTNKRKVTLTLSRIQARQARLRRLRQQIVSQEAEGPSDALLSAPYFIGQSQRNPVDLTSFLVANRYDPTTVKLLSKLKAHLLPRIRASLLKEAQAEPSTYGYALSILQRLVDEDPLASSESSILDRDNIFIDKDRLYRHEIVNVHFTSYEGRRERDIINPKTSRRDFMCLREEDPPDSPSSGPKHKFCYGRLLGIYHVNIVYRGQGALDRKPRRFDVLWVRWYKELEDEKAWSEGKLDRLSFHPLDDPVAVDFLDPAHVLRACHIIPRFSLGQVEGCAPEYSRIAKANEDWKEYMVNRFVDRDMLMRYHWGLGVGHLYSHKDAPRTTEPERNMADGVDDDAERPVWEEDVGDQSLAEDSESDSSEYTLKDREEELLDDSEGEEGSDCDGIPEPDEE